MKAIGNTRLNDVYVVFAQFKNALAVFFKGRVVFARVRHINTLLRINSA